MSGINYFHAEDPRDPFYDQNQGGSGGGGGSGDMLKSVYDTNDDGIVNEADYAANAGQATTALSAGSATTADSAAVAASVQGINAAGLNKYYGTNSGGAAGFYDIPTEQFLGDMEKSVYDTNDDGTVDAADTASTAGAVTGVDVAGASKYYGTDATSTPGFYDLPSGGGASSIDDLTDVDTTTTPPTNGQVLKYNSGLGLWEPGTDNSGGTGSNLLSGGMHDDDTTASGSAYAFKGGIYQSIVDVTLVALEAPIQLVAGASYKIIIGTEDGSNVITTLTSSTTFVSPVTTGSLVGVTFPISFSMTAGSQYFILVGRTDGVGTYALPVPFAYSGDGSSQPAASVVYPMAGGTRRIADPDPIVGEQLDTAGAASTVVPFRVYYTDARI